MKRIICHWTAGGHTPSNLDKGHYHFLIDGEGKVHAGTFPVEANRKPVKGKYAAHTLNCNTGSIGVAVCAMAGAVERPFNAGRAPITPAQMKALAALLRDLTAKYKIPVTRETVLSHAEVQPTLGIKQRGKWDIAWIPGMKAPGDPVAVGDKIRAMVKAPAPALQKPAQRVSEAKPSQVKGAVKDGAAGLAGGLTAAALVLYAMATDAIGKALDFYHWLTPLELKEPRMQINPVYGRMAVYVFAPMLGTLPGVNVDMAAGLITIDIDTALAGIGAGIAASGWVFTRWGKK